MRHSGRNSIKKNALFICLLAAVLVAYSAYGLPAKPTAVTFSQNTSANYANGAFSINWTSNTSDNISYYSVYVFNESVFVMNLTNTSANGTLFSFPANNGNYTFNISAVNATGDESENATSAWIFADLENATIILNSPANGLNISNATTIFNFTAADNTALNCSIYIDGALNQSDSVANNTPSNFSANLAEGRHLWNISCTDLANNTNTSAAYNIGIDLSAPSVALNTPSSRTWDADGRLNFTFTATDAVTAISNCSLWINATGAWQVNITNYSVANNTQSAFVFDNGTNILGNGTYLWNVQCYDNLTNSGFASQNYTFMVDNATDFTVTDVRLINSSAPQWNNPVPGSNLTINATIMNAGTLNSLSNITVALFWNDSATPLLQANISNETLASGSSTNITFTILGGNVTGFGSRNVKVSADYRNLIEETDETNNNKTLIVLSGLNVSANVMIGPSAQTPKPGDNISINLTIKYQNGSNVAGLNKTNFTIYDVYSYENGTVLTSRNVTICYFDGSQNENGAYYMNVTSPVKSPSTNRAEYGNHTIRVYAKDNKSVAYYGEDNRTSNYYTMQAPNLVISFSASSYDIDLINGVSSKTINIMVKNSGTINISNINLSIFTNSADLTLLYNSTYVRGITCNYTAALPANTTSAFIPIPCAITYNSTKNGTYTLTATADGLGTDNAVYNATAISRTIYVVNTSNIGNTASSSTSDGTAITVPAKKYNYTIDVLNYTKTLLIEQGNKSNITFAIKNKGNGTINNISVKLALPTTALWGKWYDSTKIKNVYAGETVYILTNITVPANATVATYTVTANISGEEAGSSKTVTFLIQVLPGNDTKRQITISLAGIEAQITEINDTLSKLLQNTNNINLTLASKKLSEAIRLKLEAEQSILKGDYLTAYNNKKDIEAMLPEIRELLVIEKQAVEKKQNIQMKAMLIIAFILAISGAFYYMWLPEKGYVPGKGYFKKNPTPYIARLEDNLHAMMHKSARKPSDIVREMMDKDKQNAKLLKPKGQPYNYSPKNRGSVFGLKKMSQNLMDQFKEHGKTKEKPNYNFHKKQRWSND